MRSNLKTISICAALAVLAAPSYAQTEQPTRVTPYDWQCQNESGAMLSDYEGESVGALAACLEDPAGAFVQGGRYRIRPAPCPAQPAEDSRTAQCPAPTVGSWTQTNTHTSAPPPQCWTPSGYLPVDPPAGACVIPCPAKPADESRPGTCPAGTVGSWTQTLTYSSAPAPTCWIAGPYLPPDPPEGSCIAPPPEGLVAPVLSTPTVIPYTTVPGRYTIRLAWSAVPTATSYEIRRCVVANCTGMTLIKTVTPANYDNTNLAAGGVYRYKVRAMKGTESGPMSDIVTVLTPSAPTVNSPPTITGTSVAAIITGQSYTFTPTAADIDGDTLAYTITNKPSWAGFETATGKLWGVPASTGVFSGIVISVSDGQASASLPAFSITVTQASFGSALISWTPPTQNTDGSTLTNLAGFRLYYGQTSTQLSSTVELQNAGLASYLVSNLGSGVWYFAVRSFSSGGAESVQSNVASKTIQ